MAAFTDIDFHTVVTNNTHAFTQLVVHNDRTEANVFLMVLLEIIWKIIEFIFALWGNNFKTNKNLIPVSHFRSEVNGSNKAKCIRSRQFSLWCLNLVAGQAKRTSFHPFCLWSNRSMFSAQKN